MPNPSTIAAIVVTYNRCKLLKECLLAILSQTRLPDCLIIVDNQSMDDTFDFLWNSPYVDRAETIALERGNLYRNTWSSGKGSVRVDYLRLHRNTGGAGGFQTGIRHAVEQGYDYVWMMDDDVIAETEALEALVHFSEQETDLGFACSTVFGKNRVTMNTPKIDTRPGPNGYPIWNERLQEGIARVESATFVSVFIPSNRVREVGLPIKEFFIWGDDTEYTLRISRRFPCYVVGARQVVHLRETGKSLSFVEEKNTHRIRFSYFLFRNTLYLGRKKYFIDRSYFSIVRWVVKNGLICFLHFDFRKSFIALKSLWSALFFNPQPEFLSGTAPDIPDQDPR
ncbi:MAG: glycosyltransferase family 2 protein [Rikenellaceae bacterium]|nr:glycosyltransferase family 2 protein [Rikenellaceae bacterium]